MPQNEHPRRDSNSRPQNGDALSTAPQGHIIRDNVIAIIMITSENFQNKSDVPDLNQGPTGLQPVALPLSTCFCGAVDSASPS